MSYTSWCTVWYNSPSIFGTSNYTSTSFFPHVTGAGLGHFSLFIGEMVKTFYSPLMAVVQRRTFVWWFACDERGEFGNSVAYLINASLMVPITRDEMKCYLLWQTKFVYESQSTFKQPGKKKPYCKLESHIPHILTIPNSLEARNEHVNECTKQLWPTAISTWPMRENFPTGSQWNSHRIDVTDFLWTTTANHHHIRMLSCPTGTRWTSNSSII